MRPDPLLEKCCRIAPLRRLKRALNALKLNQRSLSMNELRNFAVHENKQTPGSVGVVDLSVWTVKRSYGLMKLY